MKMSKERIILLVSTLLIVLVVGFFTIRSAVQSPLEGKWYSEENGYFLEIDDEGEAELKLTVEKTSVEVDLYYTMDRKMKTITFRGDLESFEEEAKESNGVLAASDIDAHLASFLSSFDYSVEGETVVLTEREAGEQFVFTRMK
jgi:hypothetical protein